MVSHRAYPRGSTCHRPTPQSAAAFYTGIFGWSFADRSSTGDDPRYLVASLDGKQIAAIASADPGTEEAPAWRTYICVEDAEDTAAKVREAGGTVLSAPVDLSNLGRVATCADPGGAVFGLWQHGAIKGAQTVNAPGTWNFSELNTDDVDSATRFYGTVFGWEADRVDMGAMSGHMVRMPGYADFLSSSIRASAGGTRTSAPHPGFLNASPGSCRYGRARLTGGA